MQDSFEYAFRKLNRYDPNKASFKTWLYQIAISRSRNKRRRKWLPTFSLSQLLGQGQQLSDQNTPRPDEVAMLSDRQQAVWEALGQLSPKLRETAVLRYYDGLSYREIGGILHIPPKTAESRMRLARKALRELLADQDLF
jgi:RNA polymerase sigma-70 factor (ECF subfamily)